ncbi:TetR/AcrR family transcriptional regulator [Bradyrhizobium sp. U87765 SZCCT0131]|uniref:TetR/AcrR family transcriptional regulator n=1 Tax=unclassified Bradyrhizobium TaxID=2631580 RepID=UPI001BA48646|nr:MULTISPECIES: TetR/AcrR family transcriptional regulator [unclassified Bradyrhizobium]MBR1222023.1 TetR/AcrR family transcriptional regulator [Bradyrhizobium sp. U87765 SZCCT0131]MBR1263779.1 TetR/AcrR family transcriptional regulator [Bradyrhizobium sp. U87765 SZCCT0134]MBR1302651.1 TetR/AcrR family transcriptional regulator [Bradyrhizobium sp. U87765 SZCCT0110]MBR1320029.1 TetR/AcrR family transcriptional regulator [Bradyrhizobium sp. U87765 SZCCT0109]MBR1348858.1 TetR/AcrR family transcr
MNENGRDVWIRAGLAALAAGGIDRVRVEVLAEGLGVTKGGFYRRFRDRRHLLDELLETWASGRIAAIEQHTRPDGEAARERLAAVIRLYAERNNAEAMAIELAIRQWARGDAQAAEAVASVDAARLKNVERLYATAGLDADEARARAFLFYSFVFGQGLIQLDARGPRRRDRLLEICATLLTGTDVLSTPA